MDVSLKYAVVERERRYLVASIPAGVTETRDIVDRYIDGTRLRLREVTSSDGSVVRKLNQKVRLSDGPAEVACTSVYLDEAEWALLSDLPGRVLRKRRHLVVRDGLTVAVDELPDGTMLAEIDDGESPSTVVPGWLDVVEDVSVDERWTGVRLAR
jgi:CYTH domain-containing protein